ncbi:hypothetical protein ACLBXI_30160, partial [Bacillus cereus]
MEIYTEFQKNEGTQKEGKTLIFDGYVYQLDGFTTPKPPLNKNELTKTCTFEKWSFDLATNSAGVYTAFQVKFDPENPSWDQFESFIVKVNDTEYNSNTKYGIDKKTGLMTVNLWEYDAQSALNLKVDDKVALIGITREKVRQRVEFFTQEVPDKKNMIAG